MACAEVQRLLSDGDGRILRGRRMRAHVRACRACREFKAALAERPADLAALAPAPAAAIGAMWLGRLLAAAGGSSAGGVTGTLATKTVAVMVAAATLAGTATAVHEAASRPAPTSLSDRAAVRSPDVRDAASRAARVPVLSWARPATSGGASLSTSARVAPSAKPSAVERPATPPSGEDAEPAKKASQPSAGPPASNSHGPRKATSPPKRSHGKHAGGAGHAKHAPPGHTKEAHAGHGKPAARGRAKPAHAGGAKPAHAVGAKPASPGQAKPASPGQAKPAHAGDAQPVPAVQANPPHAGSAVAGAPPEPGASGRAHASK